MTHLHITFRDMNRPEDEQKRLAKVFKDAMLNYCKDVDRINVWRTTHDERYTQCKTKGFKAVRDIIGEREKLYPVIEFKK